MTVATMVGLQYRPANAVEMTCIALKKFTIKANLRHFCVPREGCPRSINRKMLRLDCDDNPVIALFSPELTEKDK